ncbi:hypothetical protein ACTQ3J_01585 [Oscillospiraceae bacterium LCP25S3_E3]
MTLEAVLAGVGDCVSAVITSFSGNSVLLALLGIGIVSSAAGLFAKLKRSAK